MVTGIEGKLSIHDLLHSRSDRVKFYMSWCRANDLKFDPRALLTVAELGQSHLLHLHVVVRWGERSRKRDSCYEVGGSRDFFLDTTRPLLSFGAHTQTPRNIVFDSAPVQAPLDVLVG